LSYEKISDPMRKT